MAYVVSFVPGVKPLAGALEDLTKGKYLESGLGVLGSVSEIGIAYMGGQILGKLLPGLFGPPANTLKHTPVPVTSKVGTESAETITKAGSKIDPSFRAKWTEEELELLASKSGIDAGDVKLNWLDSALKTQGFNAAERVEMLKKLVLGANRNVK